MTFEQIQYFKEIVTAGSMSKAASNLIVSQPHMSMTIKALEQEVGYKLLSRNSKGVELTQQGAEFLYYADLILNNLDEIRNIKQKVPNKKVKFTITIQYVSYAVIPVIKMLNQLDIFPDTFTLKQNSFFEILSDVENGISEVGVMVMSTEQKSLISSILDKKGLEKVSIGILEMNIVLAEDHPLYQSESLTLEDVTPYPLVFFDISDKDYLSAHALSKMAFDSFAKRIIIQDFFYLHHLLKTTHAVSFLATHSTTNINTLYSDYGFKLKFFPMKDPVQVELMYVKRKAEPLSEFGQYYIDEMLKLSK